jgi:hypothetical protein
VWPIGPIRVEWVVATHARRHHVANMEAIGARGARMLGVRPGEGRMVARVSLLFATLEGARGLGEVGADAQLLALFGPAALPRTLPFLFIALGLISLIVSLGYGVALARVSRSRLFLSILVSIAALLAIERLALAAAADRVVPALWVTVFASSTLLLTLAWTVAGAVFDARQAKRVFPLLTGAAIGGSFVGTLAAGPLARVTGVETLVVGQATLLVAAAALLARLPMRDRRPALPPGRASVAADLRAGFDAVARSPLMRLVAIAYVLLSVLLFSVSFPFYIAASREFPDPVDLATALGLLSTAVTAASFLGSITLANRIYARFGVSMGALLLPVVYLLGFALWLVSFTFATAAIVRFAQQVTQRGLSNAAWSAFYSTLPADRRAQVMAFNDGVPGQAGTVLSGLLLLAASGLVTLEPVFLLGAAAALACTAVVLRIRRRYAASLLDALREGLAEQVLDGGPGLPAALEGPELRAVLLTALRSTDTATKAMAVTLLSRVDALRPDERAALGTLLADPSPGVRGAAAVALADDPADERPTTAIASLLDGSRDADLIAGLGAAARAPGRVDSAHLARLLDHPTPAVRAGAITATAAHPEGPTVVPTARLIRALHDEVRGVRAAAAGALAARRDAGPSLLDVLGDDGRDARAAALEALSGHGVELRAELLAWARARIDRAQALHRALGSLRGSTDTDGDGYLEEVVGGRARRAEDDAVAALLAVGAPSAGGLMRRSLRSRDPDVRAQAIEALDSLGDRRLGSALVACLEAAADGGHGDVVTTLARLADDEDPWIRLLSRRSLGQQTTDGEDGMPGMERMASGLDTMLALRRVPLFAGLDPEDLARIAAVAFERDYAAGDALMREGDLDDELVVITEGSVRVVQVAADGTERFIRRYGPGDHIGELAVLRERPRAATVVAEEGGVHGLVLGGEGLRSILRERPEAAMAMLATLAERISTQ